MKTNLKRLELNQSQLVMSRSCTRSQIGLFAPKIVNIKYLTLLHFNLINITQWSIDYWIVGHIPSDHDPNWCASHELVWARHRSVC